MALCETDKLYVAALYDQWVFRARKIFYHRERLMKIDGFPETLASKYENDAHDLLERAWELGVHCGILTEELRFWKAWTDEGARLEYEKMEEEYGSDEEPEVTEAELRASGYDFTKREHELREVNDRFQKLGRERSKR